MNIRRNHEHGQITILMVFAVIALFGAAALAIDGGLLYLHRRAAQGAADNAAMTGALAITKGYSSSQIEYIALERAKKNGFDNSEADTSIEVYRPPQAPNPYAGNSNYIQVIITSSIPLSFTHFVYTGPLQVTVEAVSHARVNEDIVPGFAAFGDNLNACRTIQFDGSLTFDLTGGGSLGSNSDAGCNCDGNGGSGVKDGNGKVNVYGGGGIYVSGCWQNNGGAGHVSPEPDTGLRQQILAEPPLPDCTGLPELGEINSTGVLTLQPGIYESMTFVADSWATFEPGMYCIRGANDDGWALQQSGHGTMQGDGVMFFLADSAGGWSSSGNTQTFLKASTNLEDASGNQWAGMLIYSHPSNSNEIILAGTSNSLYEGSIYAPGSLCTLQGTSGGVALRSQIICDRIRITGTGDLDIDYDMSMNYHLPAAVELTR